VSATRPLTVAGAVLDGERVGVRCAGGEIVALGPEVEAHAGDETLEADGSLLVAPLINAHTHAAMTLFRGYGGDLPLMRWLREAVWPIEAKLEPEDVYWGARLACAEMIRSGTASFWDMYWHPEETARAVRDAGMRATIGGPLFDVEGGTEEMKETALENLEKLADFDDGTIAAALAPHAIYTVSEGLLRWVAELAGERGLAVEIHLSETEQEVTDCIAQHGGRPAAYLDRLGLLGERTVLAHGVWLDQDELELIAERGCTVVANPVANMKLAVGGVLDYPAARRAGVRVALGSDGPGSNDSLDLFADLKVFALSQRHASGDPTVLPAREAWSIATGEASPLLAAPHPGSQRFFNDMPGKSVATARGATGMIRVGGPADFLLLRAGTPELGLGDLHSDLVYAAGGSVVDTTVVAGRVLMRGGEVPGAEEIVARAVERSRRLGIVP
jgi:5-methylthioadenosine/S-adenosylhomocysteine deaminase